MPTPRKNSKTTKTRAKDRRTASKAAEPPKRTAPGDSSKGTSPRKKAPVTTARTPAASAQPSRPTPSTATSNAKKPPARKVAAARTERVQEPVAVKPAKLALDVEFLRAMRDALVHQRRQLVSVVQSTQAQMAGKDGDLPDVSDRASEGFEDELAVGLMAIEAAQLDDIEAAIKRIDHGTYGLCVDCSKPIPKKRIEVLPFVRRCLACEGTSERRARMQSSYSDEEESDL